MQSSNDSSHFKGKTALEHLKEARKKAHRATESMHGVEPPGHVIAGADAAKQTSFLALILLSAMTSLSFSFSQIALLFGGTLLGWTLWKVTRTALIGWSRIEKYNRLIWEEKHEIEHHREEEKEELREMYKGKGFSGKLLDDVVDVLMADDNRLLQVMLEEEMGLELASYQHPLKQAFGTFIGILFSSALITFFGTFALEAGIIGASILTTLISSYLIASTEKNAPLTYMISDLAALIGSGLLTYFLTRTLL